MDKNKIIEAAAKLVAKGAYDKAIKEYQKILDADPKDARILQKMGELHQKKNDNAQAAHYFTKVAEGYSTDGFFLKAVALYKQVLKLDPSLVDVNMKLAELHQQLQLMGEAMSYFQIVANHYDKTGDSKRSLEILRKMVDLDPDNIASRIKLAELYSRESLNKEAIVEFRRAADHLKKNHRVDDYLRVAERISNLEPQNFPLAKELAETYLARGDQKRALAKLQVCFKADPRDIDTLKMLSTAFQGLGQTSKTLSVLKELAKVYAETGRNADADATWKQIGAIDSTDADFVARKPTAPAPPPQAAARAAPPPPEPKAAAASPVSAAPPAQPAKADSLGKLLTETDVYVKYGLHDKALEHLRKIFAADPENIDAHEKAYAIYVASNNAAQASEQLLNVLRLHTRRGDAERAAPFLTTMLEQNPRHPEVPSFMAVLSKGGARGQEEVGDEAILVDSAEEEIVVADEPDNALHVESGEIINADSGVMELEPADAEAAEQYEMDPPPVADEALDEQHVVSDEPVESGEYEAPQGAALGDYELSGDPTAERPAEAAEPFKKIPTGTVHAYPGLEVGNDETSEMPAYIEPPAQAAPPQEEVVEAPPEEEAVSAPPEEEPAQEECDEAQFFIEQNLWSEAREIVETILVAYPGHVRATELLARIDAGEGTPVGSSPEAPTGEGESKDAFDLAAELAGELTDAGGSGEVAAPAGEEFQVSVEQVFADFKKGLEKVVKPEDVDTHYDLGIAYKEMGLVDDALGEFVIARKGCVGKKKEIDCLTMSAMLHTLKGDFANAVECFKQALTSEHATGDAEKALRYELASAYESAGQQGKALGQYLRVQKLDGNYRDVAAHVSRLQDVTQPEEDTLGPPPKGKTPAGGASRKVGYV
ncbi:MAG: tetratricopeptide repeat protein [Myxococcaceae bacterium]|nr:tetratricopeptide repeat protein [Myxococcaceae bacterium]